MNWLLCFPKVVDLAFKFESKFWHLRLAVYREHTAISVKVVPKKREKVEYERERHIGKD